MNNMKKLLCLLLALVMTMAMVACGGPATPDETEAKDPVEVQTDASGKKIYDGVTLVYWSNWEAVETQGQIITEAVNEFMAETGAVVDLQFKGRTGIKEGLIPALDADQQVDMFDGAGNKSNYGDRIISVEDLMSDEYEAAGNAAMMALCRSYYADGATREVPYQSWGINRDPKAEWRLDFGRDVTIDELRVMLRADFPHDNYWTSMTVTFSDGTEEILHPVKTAKMQVFPIEKRTIRWLNLSNLIQAEGNSPFPALTQFEAWGVEAE